MDPNGSTGSSPLTDGELSKNDRQSTDEDDTKKQQSRNATQAGQNQTARKVQPANQATWRPVGTTGLNQGSSSFPPFFTSWSSF
jgi:hypothetical protein